MNKKLSIVVTLGCLFILVNMGLAGIPSNFIGRDEENLNISNQFFEKSDSSRYEGTWDVQDQVLTNKSPPSKDGELLLIEFSEII